MISFSIDEAETRVFLCLSSIICADKLFKDLGDDFMFDRSMRNFYTTPNTKVVPGDQKAFAEFLYGDMQSCKDGDPIACEKNSFR